MHKLKILQLCPRLPYPLTDGGAIGIFNITKALSDLGHDITLLTFPHSEKDLTVQSVDVLSSYAKVKLVSRPLPSRTRTLAKTLLTGGAYPIERRMMKEMFDLIDQAISNQHFDIVHVDHAHMGKYALYIQKKYGLPYVLRQHNFENIIYKRFAEISPNPLKRFIACIHAARILKEEIIFLKHANAVAAITEQDVEAMRFYCPDSRYEVIPAGVDTTYFFARDQNPQSKIITWVGSLDWDPNLDAIQYFLKDIYPIIKKFSPQLTLRIIGNGSEKLKKQVSLDRSIEVLGRVDDIRDFLGESAVLIVPLRIGGGMRLKLLDFFASGCAVVSTSIGAEGNLGVDGTHLLIRDTPKEFAEGVVDLLSDSLKRSLLGASARSLVELQYGWDKIGRKFVGLYEDLLYPVVENSVGIY